MVREGWPLAGAWKSVIAALLFLRIIERIIYEINFVKGRLTVVGVTICGSTLCSVL